MTKIVIALAATLILAACAKKEIAPEAPTPATNAPAVEAPAVSAVEAPPVEAVK